MCFIFVFAALLEYAVVNYTYWGARAKKKNKKPPTGANSSNTSNNIHLTKSILNTPSNKSQNLRSAFSAEHLMSSRDGIQPSSSSGVHAAPSRASLSFHDNSFNVSKHLVISHPFVLPVFPPEFDTLTSVRKKM